MGSQYDKFFNAYVANLPLQIMHLSDIIPIFESLGYTTYAWNNMHLNVMYQVIGCLGIQHMH